MVYYILFIALSKHRGGAYALWSWKGDKYQQSNTLTSSIASVYNDSIDEEEDDSNLEEEGQCHR